MQPSPMSPSSKPKPMPVPMAAIDLFPLVTTFGPRHPAEQQTSASAPGSQILPDLAPLHCRRLENPVRSRGRGHGEIRLRQCASLADVRRAGQALLKSKNSGDKEDRHMNLQSGGFELQVIVAQQGSHAIHPWTRLNLPSLPLVAFHSFQRFYSVSTHGSMGHPKCHHPSSIKPPACNARFSARAHSDLLRAEPWPPRTHTVDS